jgi:hypothetical protein
MYNFCILYIVKSYYIADCVLVSVNYFIYSHWIELGGGKKRRNPSGVVTLLLKECFPGLVNYNGRIEPPWTWEHYAAAPDAPDEHGVEYNNCLERVEERFWVIFCYLYLLFLDNYFCKLSNN